jgi:GT2 family glycosyltransferase
MKRVLVIILNYKTYEMTIKLIKELKKLDNALFDIYVVDNCSPNESAVVLEKESKNLEYHFHKNEKNTGYAAGNNIGIRYAIEMGYDYSLILNNDLEIIDPAFIEKLVQVGDEHPNVACSGPKILDIDHHPVAPYCERPNLFTMSIGIAWSRRKCARYIDMPRPVYRLFGCCMLLKNNAMKLVDCMDERTFLFAEEDILAERLLKYGYVSYYCPETSIVHLESATINKEQSKKSMWKTKILLNSMHIYLRDYRHYNIFSIRICQGVRFAILYIRG